MKYLQLHKLIWLILVLALTFIELVFVAIDYLIYVIWNFKLSYPFKKVWKEEHRRHKYGHNEKSGEIIFRCKTDETIKDTIIRRYHYYFK